MQVWKLSTCARFSSEPEIHFSSTSGTTAIGMPWAIAKRRKPSLLILSCAICAPSPRKIQALPMLRTELIEAVFVLKEECDRRTTLWAEIEQQAKIFARAGCVEAAEEKLKHLFILRKNSPDTWYELS